MAGRHIFLFIDESGTFDFKSSASRYFVLTAVLTEDPLQGALPLLMLRHDILARDPSTLGTKKPHTYEGFHCTEDPQWVRDDVFSVIQTLQLDAYSVIVQKNKTNPKIQDRRAFYRVVFGGLARGIIRRRIVSGDTLHVFAASFNLGGKKEDFLAGLKSILAGEGVTYFVHFHSVNSHHMLQLSDYIGWAIFKKYEFGDTRSYDLIKSMLGMEFDLFRTGTITYYT